MRRALVAVLVGAATGAVFHGRWLPQRRWLRGLAFAVLCYVVAIPGFRPPMPPVFGLFAPWFLFYGMATVWLMERDGSCALGEPPRVQPS